MDRSSQDALPRDREFSESLEDFVGRCVADDDELDALVRALMAGAVQSGLTRPVADPEQAALEGWIHLPEPFSLDRLVG